MEDRRIWPAIGYEEVPWERDYDAYDLISKSRRRKITGTYRAAIPLRIADRAVDLPKALELRLTEVTAALARFDERQSHVAYDLPAMVLRSESAASSQIERLTSSIRNVAMAEVTDAVPDNAKLIAANVAAMREALRGHAELSIEGIRSIHAALMEPAKVDFAGRLRGEQVWVGGTSYSPHEALFVPPVADRVKDCLEDLVTFSRRDDVNPIAKAAVLHGQFETIHPFADGNGRTGRALLARQLRQDGLMIHATLPISAGLLHEVNGYMDALDAYHEGDIAVIVERVADAIEVALVSGAQAVDSIESVLDGWRSLITQRKGSRIHDLPALLVKQPVVNSTYVENHLGVSQRAARDVLEVACAYGMVKPTGNAKRGVLYQSDALIAIMESMAASESMRRM